MLVSPAATTQLYIWTRDEIFSASQRQSIFVTTSPSRKWVKLSKLFESHANIFLLAGKLLKRFFLTVGFFLQKVRRDTSNSRLVKVLALHLQLCSMDREVF